MPTNPQTEGQCNHICSIFGGYDRYCELVKDHEGPHSDSYGKWNEQGATVTEPSSPTQGVQHPMIHLWNKQATGPECGSSDHMEIRGMSLLREVDCKACLESLEGHSAPVSAPTVGELPPLEVSSVPMEPEAWEHEGRLVTNRSYKQWIISKDDFDEYSQGMKDVVEEREKQLRTALSDLEERLTEWSRLKTLTAL